MKLLLSSDIHGNHAAYRWLLRTAKDLSVELVLAGDLLGFPEGFSTPEEAQNADAKKVFELLDASGVVVYYIWGNADLVEVAPPCERIRFLHGRRIEIGQWNLVGYQHSPPYISGDRHVRVEAEIAADLKPLESLADSNSVLVTHSPSYGILDHGFLGNHAGSVAIRDFINRTDVRAHVHGHVHGSFGSQGRHFNVAAAGTSRAVLLDLESMESQVLHGYESTA